MNKEEWMNKLLGDELIAHMQYVIAAQIVKGKESDRCFEEFEQHAKEEQEHFTNLLAHMVSEKMNVNSDLQTLIIQSKSGYTKMSETDRKELLEFHLKGEENVIKAYNEFIEELEKDEKPDVKLLEVIREIVKDEEEHKEDLEKILKIIKRPQDEYFDY